MSDEIIFDTQYFMEKEMEAWWYMLECIFNFLTISTNYALKSSFTDTRELMELKDLEKDINITDFPFFVDSIEEIYKSCKPLIHNNIFHYEKEPLEKFKCKSPVNIEYSEAFEKCCESMHKLEETYMQDYEKRQEEIFGLLLETKQRIPSLASSEIVKEPNYCEKHISLNHQGTVEKVEEYSEISVNDSSESYIKNSLTSDDSEYSCNVYDYEETVDVMNLQEMQQSTSKTIMILKENENEICLSRRLDVTLTENGSQSNENMCYDATEVYPVNRNNRPKPFQIDSVRSCVNRCSKIPKILQSVYKNQKRTQNPGNAPLQKTHSVIEKGQSSKKCHSHNSPDFTDNIQNLERSKRNEVHKIDKERSNKNCRIIETNDFSKRKKKTLIKNIVDCTSKNTIEGDCRIKAKHSTKNNVNIRNNNMANRYASIESVVKKMIYSGVATSNHESSANSTNKLDELNQHSTFKHITKADSVKLERHQLGGKSMTPNINRKHRNALQKP